MLFVDVYFLIFGVFFFAVLFGLKLIVILFVLIFRPLLPVGLGLAAGAMLWMVFRELLPEALENLPAKWAYPAMLAAILGMLAFQYFIG